MLDAKHFRRKTKQAIDFLELERKKKSKEERLRRIALAEERNAELRMRRKIERQNELQAKRLKEQAQKEMLKKKKQALLEREKSRKAEREKKRVERERQFALRKTEAFVRAVYHELLKAAISGKKETALKPFYDIDESSLSSYGLLISRPSKNEALLTQGQRKIKSLLASDGLRQGLMDCGFLSALTKIQTRVERLGFLSIEGEVIRFLDGCVQVVRVHLDDLVRREGACLVEDHDLNVENHRYRLIELECWKESLLEREEKLKEICQANLVQLRRMLTEYEKWRFGRGGSNLRQSVVFLRPLLRKYLLGYDDAKFSDIDVINIFRFTVGSEAISLEAVSREPGLSGEVIDFVRYEKSRRDIESDVEKAIEGKVGAVLIRNDLVKEVKKFQKFLGDCEKLSSKIRQIIDDCFLAVGDDDTDEYYFSGSRYGVSPHASLAPDADGVLPIASRAHQEITWLQSDSGREFLEYTDSVLEQLATDAYHSAEMVVADAGSGVKLFLGGVSLVAEVRADLLLMIFIISGFELTFLRSSAGESYYLLEW